MRQTLNYLIDDFHERPLPKLLKRSKIIKKVPRKAHVVIGMRRTGKTWFCYQQIQEIMAKGVDKERFLYINFEDDRLLPFSVADFNLLLETYYRKFPSFKNQECYLFLDEIQRIPGWEKFVRRVLDTENMSVYITGSSSKMLSSEIATSLRGRSLTTEIFPFDFREFLQFHRTQPGTGESYGSKVKASLQHQMDRYFTMGGFPEVQTLDPETRNQVLQNYIDVVVLRDLIERHGIKNTVALRALIRHIMTTPGTRLSINKFFNSLKSQGISCTKNDLYEYLEHITDTYLAYSIPIHTRSPHIRRVNPSKIYAIDLGLLGAMSISRSEDRGAWLENLVYLHLRNQGIQPDYYITKDDLEVDFVINPTRGDPRRLVQVCWSMEDDDTRKREIAALQAAMKESKVKDGTIVTWFEEDQSDPHIQIVPIWKWLLRGNSG